MAAAFLTMVVSGLGVLLLHRSLFPPTAIRRRRGLHALGCLMFYLVALLMFLMPVIALPFALAFSVLALIARVPKPRAGLKVSILLLLCAVFWAGYAGYEYALRIWFQSARGALMRPDFLVLVPFAYAVNVVGVYHGHSLFKRHYDPHRNEGIGGARPEGKPDQNEPGA